MSLYEIMYIIVPDLESEELDKAIDRVKGAIEKTGGQVEYEKKMGKQKLAYEIQDYKEGYYVLMHVQGGEEMISELDHVFKMNEEYMRNIVIGLDEEKMKEQEKEETEQARDPEEEKEEKEEGEGESAEAEEKAETE